MAFDDTEKNDGRLGAAEIPTAIGSTEPTAEEMCHWTPEMIALARRDGEHVPADGCGGDWEGLGIGPAASDISEGVEAGVAEAVGLVRE